MSEQSQFLSILDSIFLRIETTHRPKTAQSLTAFPQVRP